MKAPRFIALRDELRDIHMSYRELADEIGRSTAYVSNCMNGKSEWADKDKYMILGILNKKPEEVMDFFPKDGVKQLPKKQELEITEEELRTFASVLGKIMAGGARL